ncbi:hypothetical protein Cs308_0795 [Candidatus Chlamydia sanziniae]|uniref:Inclusion membrane protein A n=2 Tax=Candidatus Chlamydia sanziniae TaxID=1806891 RepID=A0A1A9HVV1_9CHLA|nr:hypothetical protein Cs308_0795 [Candidatus Chlamydia sanziniae]
MLLAIIPVILAMSAPLGFTTGLGFLLAIVVVGLILAALLCHSDSTTTQATKALQVEIGNLIIQNQALKETSKALHNNCTQLQNEIEDLSKANAELQHHSDELQVLLTQLGNVSTILSKHSTSAQQLVARLNELGLNLLEMEGKASSAIREFLRQINVLFTEEIIVVLSEQIFHLRQTVHTFEGLLQQQKHQATKMDQVLLNFEEEAIMRQRHIKFLTEQEGKLRKTVLHLGSLLETAQLVETKLRNAVFKQTLKRSLSTGDVSMPGGGGGDSEEEELSSEPMSQEEPMDLTKGTTGSPSPDTHPSSRQRDTSFSRFLPPPPPPPPPSPSPPPVYSPLDRIDEEKDEDDK